MENTEKKGFGARVQAFLDTPKGRILLNYLYSWGAAIVILGALFKLTHIKGADIMLFIGMGTEVLVFFISGFERPYIPDTSSDDEEEEEEPSGTRVVAKGGNGGVIVIGGGAPASGSIPEGVVAAGGDVTPVQADADALAAAVAHGSGQSSLNVEGVENITGEYLEQLRDLTEKMKKISTQSDKIGQSAEEIETLGRTLISLNTFYEMQLRSVSNQMDTIDQVNGQTGKMLKQIEELNALYSRMVQAMKVNSNIGNPQE